MVPVTLGLGLINLNAVVDTFFAARLIDRYLAPRAINRGVPPLHAPAGDVLRRRRDRPLPVARRGSRLAATSTASAARSRPDSGRSRSCSFPASVVSRRARRADRAPRSTSAATSRRRRRPPSRRRSLPSASGSSFNGFDADAEPRVLQPAVELDPDVGRARQPRPQRRARRDVLPPRHLGDPARDVDRQHRRDGRAPRASSAAGSAGIELRRDRAGRRR